MLQEMWDLCGNVNDIDWAFGDAQYDTSFLIERQLKNSKLFNWIYVMLSRKKEIPP